MSDFSSVELKDLDKFYRGVVVDNNDPSEYGRIKINVFGVFDGIATEHIPWAKPATALFRGAGVGYGFFDVPEEGSYVWCFFEVGDIYQPVFFAAAPDGVHGLPSERTTNYPNRVVWKTKNDITIYIDDTDKEIKVSHPSGTYIKIDTSGNIEIKGTTVHINPI
jgi:uncharacterized protein involved in type VI secretion and phage assembly